MIVRKASGMKKKNYKKLTCGEKSSLNLKVWKKFHGKNEDIY